MTGRVEDIRALVLLEQARPTGLVLQLVELLARLRDHAILPRLICVLREGVDAGPLVARLEDRGITHDIVREAGPFDVAPLRRIREIVAEWRPDVLQTHGYKTAAYALALGAGGGSRPPWVAFYHGRTTTDWKVRLYHGFERWAMHRADAIAPVSPGVESHFRPADRARLVPVPNGVIDLPAAARSTDDVRRTYGLNDGDVVVGFVGRMSDEKAPDVFVQTLRRVHGRRSDVVGLMVGDGPMRPVVEELADAGPPRVEFTGRLDSMREVYGVCDAILIPSRSEVFPNVLLEAVDAGVAVAAAPVGGIPRIAEGLESVTVAPDGRPDSLADALVEALDAPSATRADARTRLRSTYAQSVRAELVARLYGDLVGGRT